MKVTDDFLKNVGKRLKEAREQKRFSQKELAGKMDIIPNQYSKVETGRVVPSLKTLVKAAHALNVSLDELVFGYSVKANEAAIKDTQMADRIKIINELSGEDRTIALQLLDLIVVKKKFKDMVKDIHTLHK